MINSETFSRKIKSNIRYTSLVFKTANRTVTILKLYVLAVIAHFLETIKKHQNDSG